MCCSAGSHKRAGRGLPSEEADRHPRPVLLQEGTTQARLSRPGLRSPGAGRRASRGRGGAARARQGHLGSRPLPGLFPCIWSPAQLGSTIPPHLRPPQSFSEPRNLTVCVHMCSFIRPFIHCFHPQTCPGHVPSNAELRIQRGRTHKPLSVPMATRYWALFLQNITSRVASRKPHSETPLLSASHGHPVRLYGNPADNRQLPHSSSEHSAHTAAAAPYLHGAPFREEPQAVG